MSKNNKQTKKKFVLKRKTLFIILYLVILPVFVITALYVVTYQNNKINPFKTEKAETEVIKMRGKDFNKFSFVFQCVSYRAPATPESVQFKAAAFDEKVPGNLTTISMKVVLGAKWSGYLSNESSTGTITYKNYETEDELSSSDFRTVTISGVKKKFPDFVLLFVNVKAPKAYVLLSFESSTGEEYNYQLSYSYNEYFGNNALGGI